MKTIDASSSASMTKNKITKITKDKSKATVAGGMSILDNYDKSPYDKTQFDKIALMTLNNKAFSEDLIDEETKKSVDRQIEAAYKID